MTKLKNFFADSISNFEIPIPPALAENSVAEIPKSEISVPQILKSEISVSENLPPAQPCSACHCPAIWESIYRDSVFRCLECEPPPPKFTSRILHLATDLADDSLYWLENGKAPRAPDDSPDFDFPQINPDTYQTFTRTDQHGRTHATHVHRSLIQFDFVGRITKIRLAGGQGA